MQNAQLLMHCEGLSRESCLSQLTRDYTTEDSEREKYMRVICSLTLTLWGWKNDKSQNVGAFGVGNSGRSRGSSFLSKSKDRYCLLLKSIN